MVSKATLASCAAAICTLVNVTPASAQANFAFDLSAQPLEKSLRAVASQTGTNIVFLGTAVNGRNAPSLRGSFSAASAYRHLLQGSGLMLRSTSGGSYVVSAPGAEATQGPAEPAAKEDEPRGPGSIAGHVVQADTGRNIAGALVRIEETGQTATADDLGHFRFIDLPPGRYTLKVSFLGLQPVIIVLDMAPGKQINAEFTMGDAVGQATDIIVYGSRSARANALNLQRTAENSADVVSADDLGNFTGTTFSEALRRVAGVSFQRDGLTGDGTNIMIRGLDPDMNNVQLNGLSLPVGNGIGRSPDLSNLLADSVAKITVNKTLLPSQDSAGTGGLVQIETLSPLNRPHRYANFLVEGGKSGKGFTDDFLASGTLAGTFGADRNFGLSASVQYRRNNARNISYNSILRYGEFLPPDANGMPTLTNGEAVNPNANFPYLEGVTRAFPSNLVTNFNYVRSRTLAATLSAEWKIGTHTNLKFDFQHDETKRTTIQLGDVFTADLTYEPMPGITPGTGLSLDVAPGNSSLTHTQQYLYDLNARITTDTYSFNGKTTVGKFEFDYLLGYAHGSEFHPSNFGEELRMPNGEALPGYFLPGATDPTLGYIISPFGPRTSDNIPLPLLSDAGWDYVNNATNFMIENASGGIDKSRGLNNSYTAKFGTRFNIGWGFLSYIEAGIQYEYVKFKSSLERSQLRGSAPISALGLDLVPSDLARIGITGPSFSVISQSELENFVNNISKYVGGASGLTLVPNQLPPDTDKQYTLEENLAGYVQARLQFGKLEIIGGARVNQTRLKADNLVFPVYIGPIDPSHGGGLGIDYTFQNAFTKLVPQKAVATDVLPRVLLNYRKTDNLIFRGGYFLSVARPQIRQLSSQTQITFMNIPTSGPQGVKPILTIDTGNPDLKPAITHNFDLSTEYYDKHIGVIKLSGFYKRIKNLLQANMSNGPAQLAAVPLPDSIYFQGVPYFDPKHPENYFITGSTPANSDHMATLWGIETQLERRFNFLPGALGGLGIYANYTFTKSSRAQIYNWAYGAAGAQKYEYLSIPFNNQPKHSGTVAATYNKYGIDATLTYSFQSRTLSMFNPRNLSVYDEGVHTLDFRIEYYFHPKTAKFRIYFEATNLLKSTNSPDMEQTFGGVGNAPKFYTQATYLGGRRFKIGASATF